MRKISEYLSGLGIKQLGEGSSSREERQYLMTLVRRIGATLIGEVGFNIGLSSHTFLKSSPKTHVVS